MESFPPCPECGGKCAFFSNASNPIIPYQFMWPIKVNWYICLECEYTTLRIHPDDLKRVHRAAEKSAEKLPKPCSECGGERIAFKCSTTDSSVWVCASEKGKPVYLYLWTCLQCGSVEVRPHPKDADIIRKASKNKYLRFM